VKTQVRILIFMACLNLSVGLVVGLQLAGTEFVQAGNHTISAEEYEEHFNATDVAEGWKSSPFSGIPIIGDIFSGLNFLWSNFQYLIDGFPIFLQWISDTYILDAETQAALNYVIWALRGLYAIMITIFAIEFISGRVLTD